MTPFKACIGSIPVNIYRRIVQFVEEGRSFAAALVLMADGSTPCEAGKRAVLDETGRIWGTIGGGQVEAEAQRRAEEVCREGRPAVLDINLEGTSAESDSPICGGAMRVLLDPTVAKNRSAYQRAAAALEERHRGVLVTRIRPGSPPEVEVEWLGGDEVPPDGEFPDSEQVRSCLEDESARLFTEGTAGEGAPRMALVEPVAPDPLLLIAGGGHIGQALARQAVLIGFDVEVIDDRPEFTDPSLFPEFVRTRSAPVGEALRARDLDDGTFVVIVTRGHRHDAEALAACVGRPAAYVGMIGSRRKVGMIREKLLDSGRVSEEDLDRVYAPIGLDIGAETVPEIATSIAAELISIRRRGHDAPPPDHMVQR